MHLPYKLPLVLLLSLLASLGGSAHKAVGAISTAGACAVAPTTAAYQGPTYMLKAVQRGATVLTPVNVTLVPLNGASCLRNRPFKKLIAIYQKVGIELLITQDDSFYIDPSVWDIADPQGKLDIGGSRAQASYTAEERALYRYYATERGTNPDRYYVFLANTLTTTGADVAGFMPLKRQYGFIFSTTNLPRLIAHELGHGIFGLQHTYAGQREGTTDLRMNTGGGKGLSHLNWPTIHAPGLQLYAFQKDEERNALGVPKRPKFPITTNELEEIFPSANKERIIKVVDAINTYSNEFGLITKNRMAHFLAQIGTETEGLEQLDENSNYNARAIFTIFLKTERTVSQGAPHNTHKYCDVIEGYNCSDTTSCLKLPNYQGPRLCTTTPAFYFPTTVNSAGERVPDFATWSKDHNVKQSYVDNSILFDYVYSCRMGNGAKSTRDGSRYRGKGFIQLTGKDKYQRISEAWNKKYPNDLKEFNGADIDELKNNVEVAMKASLIYWEVKNINGMIDGSANDLLKVTAMVNLGYYNRKHVTTSTVNGYDQRKRLYEKAKKLLQNVKN